jgi:hypothetical protein
MDDLNRNLSYNLTKGLINGHEKNSSPVYGVFLGVSAETSLYLLKTRFTAEPIETGITQEDLLALLNAPRMPEKEDGEGGGETSGDSLLKYGERLKGFIESRSLLVSEKGTLDAKAIERKITYFCSSELEISAVTFVDVIDASPDEAASLIASCVPDSGEGKNDGEGAAEDDEGEGKKTDEIFIECAAVIDPVAGLPVSKLVKGQEVCCRLPETSPFYQICQSSIPDFNGIVSGSVTGIKINEFGSAVVAVNLAEGISGAIKVQSSIWIKTTGDAAKHGSTANSANREITRNILLGTIGAALLLLAIGIFFYFMN